MRTLLLLMFAAGIQACCEQSRAGDIAAPEKNRIMETIETALTTETEQVDLQWLTRLFTC